MAAGRRQFIVGLGAAAAGAGIAAPALADTTPNVQWKLTSSFPTSLDLIYGGTETLAAAVSDMTDGHFTIKLSPPGEIAPALEALDAVADGRADCAHTALSYYWKQEPELRLRLIDAVWHERASARGVAAGRRRRRTDRRLPRRAQDRRTAGRQHRGQMAGWFRSEIRSPADFKGLKLRIGGFAGKVFQTLGAEPVATARMASIRRSNRARSTASNGSAPTTTSASATARRFEAADLEGRAKLLLPRLVEGRMQLHLAVAKDKFDALPKSYQAALRAAAAAANAATLAKYDAANPGALKRLVVGGAQLRLFPQDALEACYKTSNDLYAQLSATIRTSRRSPTPTWRSAPISICGGRSPNILRPIS